MIVGAIFGLNMPILSKLVEFDLSLVLVALTSTECKQEKADQERGQPVACLKN